MYDPMTGVNRDPQVTELARQPDRETKHYHCRHCDEETTHARVYPYEMYPLGYRGEISAYVCLVCGGF